MPLIFFEAASPYSTKGFARLREAGVQPAIPGKVAYVDRGLVGHASAALMLIGIAILFANFFSANMYAAVTDLFPEQHVGRATGSQDSLEG
jgi:hypothetical protein